MRDACIDFLGDLVAIDSVNPSLAPGGAGEREIAIRIGAELRASGLDVTVSDAAPGRTNVVGVLDKGEGPTLMLCGHSDTVSVEGMSAPFDPVLRDNRLYGRGAQDMKGGVAAAVSAATKLARESRIARGRVVVAIVADEEYTSIGAEALVREWKADAAIVTEPTDLRIAIGHKGFEWVEVTTRGVAAHGSRHADGVDAILMMGRVLQRLEALDGSFITRAHPLLGRPSLHASLIEGGREISTYPDRCTLSVERRTIAGEAAGVLLDEVNAILHDLARTDAKFSATAELKFTRAPYLTPEEHVLPRLIASVSSRPTETAAMTYWTDAAVLGHAGIPSVVFGPGGAGLHSIEEYVLVDEVLACRDALVETAVRFCA